MVKKNIPKKPKLLQDTTGVVVVEKNFFKKQGVT